MGHWLFLINVINFKIIYLVCMFRYCIKENVLIIKGFLRGGRIVRGRDGNLVVFF